jgi:lactoylglutathione lyase
MITSLFPIITTPDLERALAFYRDLLGGTVVYAFPPEGPPVFVSIDIGDSHLGFGHDPTVDTSTASRIALWLYTDDCDATVAAVRAAGGAVTADPADQPWGERVGYVTDPDGNPVVIGQRLR